MTKLAELASLTKCCFHLDFNPHKNRYESVETYIGNHYTAHDRHEDITNEMYSEMVSKDTIVQLQVYSQTPVGFYIFWGVDIENIISVAVQVVKGENK